MHDFTKEELKYIHDTMVNIVEVYPDAELPYSIRDKLQRLIETYDKAECEHEFVTPLNENFRPIGSTTCLICGEKG